MVCCIGRDVVFALSAACKSEMNLAAVRLVPMTPHRHCKGCAMASNVCGQGYTRRKKGEEMPDPRVSK